MRVLYVNHTGRVSGGEHSLLGLIGALPASVEATVACPDGPLADDLRRRRVPIRRIHGTDGSLRLHPVRSTRAMAEMGIAARQVRQAAVATGADVVHANSVRAGLVAVGARVRPTVTHVRDCLPPGPVAGMTMRVLSRADTVIANSEYTRSTLGAASPKSRVVHNAVDIARFEATSLDRAAARDRLGIDAGPVLAVIAQITPWKGQDDAIRIAERLASGHPGLKLLIVGSAKFDSGATRYDNRAYLSGLEAQISAASLGGSVRLLGEREDIPEILAAVDVLLVPSWEEPFGRTVIEAMAAGVPVLATEVGGPAEILADGGGFVAPPRSPERWAEILDDLLAQPRAVAEIGEVGRRRARRDFGIEAHVEAVLDVYRATLDSRSAL